MKTIRDILPDRFKYTLSPAEEKLIAAVQTGAFADFRTGDKEADKPENAKDWGPERTIRGTLIHWFCTDKEATELAHVKGVQVRGAKVEGDLDFEASVLPRRLVLSSCAFGQVILRDAETQAISFQGSSIGPVNADGLVLKGGLFLSEAKVKGGISLINADIVGNLDCTNAIFNNEGGVSFFADRLRTSGSLTLANVNANGMVRMLGAQIGTHLECDGATFINKGGFSFAADVLVTRGCFFFRGVKAKGETRLPNANIGASFECDGTILINRGKTALNADGVVINNSLFLRDKFKTIGEVRLLNASINGGIDCGGATFVNPGGVAFDAGGINVKSSVHLNCKKALGGIVVSSADIGGDLVCEGAEFVNEDDYALICQDSRIKGGLLLRRMKKPEGVLDLTHTKAGVFLDDGSGWPEKGKLDIDGFEYGGLTGTGTIKDAKRRIDWLHLQPDRPFNPQPYEQLAKVLRRMGHEADAKEILIAKQEDLRKSGQLRGISWFWNLFLKWTIGHGYKPIYAITIILYMMLLGFGVFYAADGMKVMQPSKERVYLDAGFKQTGKLPSRYPRFEPFIYSADVFIPFVNLHQEDYWLPDATKKHGWCFRVYMWAHIALGWIFSTLAVASLTGLIRKD